MPGVQSHLPFAPASHNRRRQKVRKMNKKTLSLILTLIFIFTLSFTFTGCAKKEKKVEKPKEKVIVLPHVMPEAEEHLQKACRLRYEKKIDKAIEEYKKALKIQPDSGVIHAGIASVYEQKGDKEQALSHYKLALKYQPDGRQDCKDAIARLEGKQKPITIEKREPEPVEQPPKSSTCNCPKGKQKPITIEKREPEPVEQPPKSSTKEKAQRHRVAKAQRHKEIKKIR